MAPTPPLPIAGESKKRDRRRLRECDACLLCVLIMPTLLGGNKIDVNAANLENRNASMSRVILMQDAVC